MYGNSHEHCHSHSIAGPLEESRAVLVQFKDRVQIWRRTVLSFCLSPVFPPSFIQHSNAGTGTGLSVPVTEWHRHRQPASPSDRMAQRLSLSLPVTEWHIDRTHLSHWQKHSRRYNSCGAQSSLSVRPFSIFRRVKFENREKNCSEHFTKQIV